jgi:hypothetical protein
MYNAQSASGEIPWSGPPFNLKGSDTYHTWTLLGTSTYYTYTADRAWLDSVWPTTRAGCLHHQQDRRQQPAQRDPHPGLGPQPARAARTSRPTRCCTPRSPAAPPWPRSRATARWRRATPTGPPPSRPRPTPACGTRTPGMYRTTRPAACTRRTATRSRSGTASPTRREEHQHRAAKLATRWKSTARRPRSGAACTRSRLDGGARALHRQRRLHRPGADPPHLGLHARQPDRHQEHLLGGHQRRRRASPTAVRS